mmetsp:Transcript_20385/g.29491  ORF Transcript_20385/g.29491 Transcript_20385/m.29491 type:complete len:95 (-) Transcript_20385:98-382(-)
MVVFGLAVSVFNNCPVELASASFLGSCSFSRYGYFSSLLGLLGLGCNKAFAFDGIALAERDNVNGVECPPLFGGVMMFFFENFGSCPWRNGLHG